MAQEAAGRKEQAMIAPVSSISRVIDTHARELTGCRGDYDRLLDAADEFDYVLLGEATHGTHEFYLERARITQRLIEEKGFRIVAAEADFPDALRAHRYAQRNGEDRDSNAALGGFRRFPAWMWRNRVMTDFLDWLRLYNAHAETKAGFYGLDLYSLHASIEEVLTYLDQVDPKAAARARERYSCFDHFDESPLEYGRAAVRGDPEGGGK